ncbi:hypothetical protein DL96DRAFT_1581015 [Flagelloscypha sp. PMI_526]|nr:hypothetical protein DL96DRAFT_1581015 [Flagelloscypha sp. PMI_526]
MSSMPQVPPEIVETILQTAARSLPTTQHTSLMLVSKLAYMSVSKITYSTIIIVSPLQFSNLSELLKSEGSQVFASSVRALCVWIEPRQPSVDFSHLWTIILPSLPNVSHVSTWYSSWTPALPWEPAILTQVMQEVEALFKAIMSRPRLEHLRLDFRLNAMLPMAKSYVSCGNITHLTLVRFDQISASLLTPFVNVSHLLLLTCGDWTTAEFSDRIHAVLQILPSLKVVILWDGTNANISNRELPNYDPRIVYDIKRGWGPDYTIQQFGKVAYGYADNFWVQAEQIVRERME